MRREGCLAARLFAACGVAWADAMGGACLLGRERAGAVARLPRAVNRRWCGRCELCRCGFAAPACCARGTRRTR